MNWTSPAKQRQFQRINYNYSSKPKIIGDKYEVLESIGAGVLGTCYKVRSLDTEALLVAKEISIHNMSRDNNELVANDGCHGQFNKTEKAKEASILSKLKNKYLIKLFDYFVEYGNIYLITEY